jgi:hypothetical protein
VEIAQKNDAPNINTRCDLWLASANNDNANIPRKPKRNGARPRPKDKAIGACFALSDQGRENDSLTVAKLHVNIANANKTQLVNDASIIFANHRYRDKAERILFILRLA